MILPIRSPKVSVKNKLLSIVLVCGATVFFSLLSLFLLVQRTERLWFEYSNHLEARRILVTTMLNAAGYGRGIHAFKNLVLRGDLAYAAVARQGFDDSISAAEAYLTIEDIEPRELKAVQIFKKTLTEYRDNIARAVQMIDQKAPVAEIDALVKVDDTPAVAGLEEVLSHLVEHETLAQAAQLDALRQFWWIALGIVFIFFGLGAGYAYLLGSTLSSGLRTLRKSATDLEAGRLDREIVCNTGDELQSLAETFDH
ncbi:MAG: hypothetical protein KDD62_10155, partial [Bdellovibrionales bacterium]|nr:hypothetical protein [Bdellovibrionales bacterium]